MNALIQFPAYEQPIALVCDTMSCKVQVIMNRAGQLEEPKRAKELDSALPQQLPLFGSSFYVILMTNMMATALAIPDHYVDDFCNHTTLNVPLDVSSVRRQTE